MNLHSLISPYVGAVNPPVLVSIRISTGVSDAADDGSRTPLYGTPGAIQASVAGSVLTVASVGAGSLAEGQSLADLTAALLPGTSITSQLTGDPGGPGTYSLNRSYTVPIALEPMTTSLQAFAQVQPMTSNDLRQVEHLNLGGNKKAIYVNGALDGVVRVKLKGGDLVILPDDTVWLVAMDLEGWDISAGWSKAAMVLQDGS